MSDACATQVPWVGPKWAVAVAAGALSSSRSDWLVEKLVELGAWSMQPLLTQRSRSLGEKQLLCEGLNDAACRLPACGEPSMVKMPTLRLGSLLLSTLSSNWPAISVHNPPCLNEYCRWPTAACAPGREASGTKGRVISAAAALDPGDDESPDELTSRQARWQRVAVAAVKQSLRHSSALLVPGPCGAACQRGCAAAW